jgi:uncharacterized damage-inducible protein DinB
MSTEIEKTEEVWLRGPITGVSPLLQPAAHALLQANEEIHQALSNFPDELIWQKPAGVASVAFHVRHIKGVLDRLFTYAEGAPLSADQLKYLSGEATENAGIKLAFLLSELNDQMNASIERLKRFDQDSLTALRFVGRKKLPSTVLGLLFHSAEHTMRHTGQLLVTARILK